VSDFCSCSRLRVEVTVAVRSATAMLLGMGSGGKRRDDAGAFDHGSCPAFRGRDDRPPRIAHALHQERHGDMRGKERRRGEVPRALRRSLAPTLHWVSVKPHAAAINTIEIRTGKRWGG